MLSGLGFLPGRGDLPRPDVWEEERDGADGTAEVVRREGFLWVWDDGSTFRRCEVTDSPLEIWSKTAPMSDAPPFEAPFAGIGGGGGGALSKFGSGGGGGAPGPAEGEEIEGLASVWPDWTSLRASTASIPSLFQVTPEG